MDGYTQSVLASLDAQLRDVEVRLGNRLGAFMPSSNLMPGPSGGGGMEAYYHDIKAILDRGSIQYCGIESMNFPCVTNVVFPGVGLTQPFPVPLEKGYMFAMRRIYGYMADPGNDIGNIVLITYQIRQEGLDKPVFRQRQRLADLVGGAGTQSSPMVLETPYIFGRGATIMADFAVGVLPVAWANAAVPPVQKAFGVSLCGDLFFVG